MNRTQFDEMVINEGYREEMLKFIHIYNDPKLEFDACVAQITDYVRSLNLPDEKAERLLHLFAMEVDDANTINYVLENFGFQQLDILNLESLAPYEGLGM